MKTKFIALALATATALSLSPKPAAANDKGLAIVGGFLGGLIVASAINDSRHDNAYDNCDATVVVANRGDDCRDAGFWREVCVQVWVPGVWIVERNHYGSYRRYVSGHYENRNNRVWVANNRYDRHDRGGRNDRDNRHDYGHDRR